MKQKNVSIVVITLVVLLLVVGIANAISSPPSSGFQSPLASSGDVSSDITYQGRLTDANGNPLDGTYNMYFDLYDAPTGGTYLWSSGFMSIDVDNGLFSVALSIDRSDFDGQSLWLGVVVEGEALSPRQEILPAPYALSLRPGVEIRGRNTDVANNVFSVFAPATGTAIYGEAQAGTAIFGHSYGGDGITALSESNNGLVGNTGRSDNNYGLYTSDNLYALNYTLAGSTMQVMQNNGDAPLSPGDVVVFSGLNRDDTITGAPIVQVSKTGKANSTAVAGVVFSRFNIGVISPDAGVSADAEVTPAGDAAPGEYVLVVVHGPAEVNADASSASIQPGDLLATQDAPGRAGKAATFAQDGAETTTPGAVFGKALEALDGTQGKIYVFVTLQ